jgi:hypothetical protein
VAPEVPNVPNSTKTVEGPSQAVKGSLGLSMQAGEGWADLPATTRPLQRVRPEAARGRVATGSDRQSGRDGRKAGTTMLVDTDGRDGEEVGDEGGTCPIVDVEQGLIHCTGTMRLPGGEATLAEAWTGVGSNGNRRT